MDTSALTVVHRRRLRAVWRSAGWPCQDLVEVELLAAGWLERLRDEAGRETLRVSDAGVQVLAATLQRNRATRRLCGLPGPPAMKRGREGWRSIISGGGVQSGHLALPVTLSSPFH